MATSEYQKLIRRSFKKYKINPEKALKYLDEAIGMTPEIPFAYIAKSTTLLSLSRNIEALDNVEMAIQKYEGFAKLSTSLLDNASLEFRTYSALSIEELWESLATIRYQLADYDGARKACAEGLKKYPNSSRCFYLHGVAGLAGGSWQLGSTEASTLRRALKSAVRLSKSRREQAAALFASGTLLARTGNTLAAYINFELSVFKQPSSFESWMRSGEYRSRLGKHRRAQVAYETAVQLRPSHTDAKIQVGNSLRRQGLLDEALVRYAEVCNSTRTAVEDKAEAKYQIGSIMETKGLPRSAEAAYRDAIRHYPGHARSLNNLASVLIAQSGLNEEATRLYHSAVQADPLMFEAYNNLGGNLLLSGKADEAVQYLEYALILEKNEPQIYFNLGLAYRKCSSSRQNVSLSYLRTALKLNPMNKDYYWELARSYNYLQQNHLVRAVLDAMTKTLRNGWRHVLNHGQTIESYIHRDIGDSIETHANRSIDQPADEGQEDSRQKAVIMILCCGGADELKDLHYSLGALHRHFVSRYKYPVVILHDNLNETDMSSLKASFLTSSAMLRFEKIKLEFPRNMSAKARSRVPNQLFLAGHVWGLGYRHMSNFFCDDVFYLDIFQDYEYYWRLDADSFLLEDVHFDVFAHMAKHRKVYGYMVVTQEDSAVVEGLWTATQEYMVNNGVKPKSLAKHLNQTGAWNRNMFYTNFEISRFDFWRSREYRSYLSALQQSGGIYLHRWGDAPIHLLAVSLLLSEESLEVFQSISYWHQYYVNLV